MISYGLSSYGYDLSLAPEFMVFKNSHPVLMGPKGSMIGAWTTFRGSG